MSLHKLSSRVPKDDECTTDDRSEVSKVTTPDFYVPSEFASGLGCTEYDNTLPTMINLTE